VAVVLAGLLFAFLPRRLSGRYENRSTAPAKFGRPEEDEADKPEFRPSEFTAGQITVVRRFQPDGDEP